RRGPSGPRRLEGRLEGDVVVGRWRDVVVGRSAVGSAAAALLPRDLRLDGGEQQPLLLVPAGLAGVGERPARTVGVVLEVLQRGAVDRRAPAAAVVGKRGRQTA